MRERERERERELLFVVGTGSPKPLQNDVQWEEGEYIMTAAILQYIEWKSGLFFPNQPICMKFQMRKVRRKID